MGLSGVYQLMVLEFTSYYKMELHIKQEFRRIQATLKDGVLDRTFFNGSVNGAWKEEDANSFLFRNAQIDNYVDMDVEGQECPVNLTPPGGYHIGGVTMAGTVLGDAIVGTITLQGDLVISFTGRRIPGRVPEVNDKIRTDARYGKNRYCTCGTGSCTHRGYCDSCQIFESIHCTPPLNEDGTQQWAYREDVVVVPTSVGGDTSGVQIPFTLYNAGSRTAGTWNASTKTFNATSA